MFALVLLFSIAFAQQDVPNVCEHANTRPPPLLESQMTTRGPASGSLFICGGAATRLIYDEFRRLAGGNSSRILYVPTNSGNNLTSPEQIEQNIESFLRLTGWMRENIIYLHTYEFAEADTEQFASVVDSANAIWMVGGRQRYSTDAYGTYLHPSRTLIAFYRLLDRGGLFGGSSAGALVQSDVMIRGECGASQPVDSLYYGNEHTEGFGFVTNLAIDGHLIARRLTNELPEVVALLPHVLGIGIDEDTAVIFKGDELAVFGAHYITVVDHTLWEQKWYCAYHMTTGTGRFRIANGGKFFFLAPGDVYDVRIREVVALGRKESNVWE